jgi:hypothetical protein
MFSNTRNEAGECGKRSDRNPLRKPKKITLLVLLMALSLFVSNAIADTAVVVWYKPGCDYLIADGTNGYYLLEWYGGYDPIEGDVIIGKLNSYGLKNVYYQRRNREGKIYVEDYLLSRDDAIEKYFQHCE